ncbi:MAG: hypothetical protein EB084_18535 [Proteobacteria bacterium]|nr:hypothetical protein [Pseudomonadota bacterium]
MDTLTSLGGYCSRGYDLAIKSLRSMADLGAHEAVGGGRDLSTLSHEAQVLLEQRALLSEAKTARSVGDLAKMRDCMSQLKAIRAMRGLKAINPFAMLATDAMIDSLQVHERDKAFAQLNDVRQGAGQAPIQVGDRSKNLLLTAFAKRPELTMANLDERLRDANAGRAARGSRPIDTDTMIYLWANGKDPHHKQAIDPAAVHAALNIDVEGFAGGYMQGIDRNGVEGLLERERLDVFNRIRKAADLAPVDALAMKVVRGNEGLAGFDFDGGFKASNATRTRNGRAPLTREQYLYVLHTRSGGPSLVSPPQVPPDFTRVNMVPEA